MNDGKPHILFITCHDLGRHLGCYGISTVQSPHLDALAAEGARFSQAFTTSPTCSQSCSALATGRYPHSNGVMGLAHPPFDWTLGPKESHMAQILSGTRYQTHLFGQQPLTNRVDRLGFDHLHGYDRALGCHYPSWGGVVSERFSTYVKEVRPENPLYMEINLEEPHRSYDQGGALPDDERGVHIPAYLPDVEASREELARLQGAIRQADRGVGRILAALDRAGWAENTLVIFSADHGLAMLRAKCTLYDPGIETALIVRWPRSGTSGGGQVMMEMISNVDIFRRHTELCCRAVHPRAELYDLETDPLEQHNLAGTEPVSEIERGLDAALRAWMDRTDDPLLQGPVPSPSWRQAMEEWNDHVLERHGKDD